MKEINLDATAWVMPSDFYKDLLAALEAPDWHSYSIAAINDSMVGGGINGVEPPYIVKIFHLIGRPDSVVEEVKYAEASNARARAYFLEHDNEVVKAYLYIVKAK